jgi:outer membrane protein assembly factor BamB/tRNA A-37 threonylcarbamoyl transferase component Bud32
MTEFPMRRRQVLQATAGALAAGAVSGRGAAQEASGPTVYVGSGDRTLYAVDAATGEEEWAFETGGEVDSSPTVVDGTVYVGSDDENLYAVDAATGSKEWAFETGLNVYSSPTVVDGTVYVGSADDNLYAVDAGTGGQEWAFDTGDLVFSSPTVADGTVYVGSADGKLYAVDAGTGEREWAFETRDSVGSSPTVVDGTVYVGSVHDNLYAVDAGTGSRQWTFETNGNVSSSPAVVDGTVYVGSDDGKLYAVDAETGEQEWAFETGDDGYSSPTVVDGTVYVGSGSALYAVDAGTGQQEWAFDTGQSVVSSPTVVDGTVYVGSSDFDNDDGTLYAIDAETGEQEWAFDTGTLSSPTVVDDPESGDSIGSRVMLGTLGHHGNWRYATAEFSVSITDTTKPVAGGDLTVTAEVTNQGDVQAEQSVELDAGSLGTDSATVSLDGGATATETLSVSTSEGDAGEYTLTVTTQDSEATASVTVDATGSPGGGDTGPETGDGTAGTTGDGDGGGGGLGTPEMLAVGGGGGGIALLGLYALMRNAGDDDSETDQSSVSDGPDEPGAGATAASAGRSTPGAGGSSANAAGGSRGNSSGTDSGSDRRIPETIPAPSTRRRSLSYDDIETGDLIGRGGNADVYRATAATDDGEITLAVKEPRMGGGETLHEETVERMMTEAETWQQLDNHDHIVGVLDYDAEPLPWIAMEYMDGSHLGNRAEEMSPAQKLWTTLAVTDAVHHAHRRGIAHRDLKPENILFRRVEDAWDAPKVADWGLSKHLLEHSKSRDGMTVEYAAPEQFSDDVSTDDHTDVYQLGAVFYELFTGQPPFEGDMFTVMKQVETEQPTPPSEIANVPAGLDDVLLTALAKEKADRYETVVHLQDDLQDLFDQP